MIDIGIRKMRVFLSVAEEGSFTKASAKHSISQPAATSIVNQIEEIIGAELFERAGSIRQPKFTKIGQEVSEVFSQLVQTHDEMMRELVVHSGVGRPKRIIIQSQYTDAFSGDWLEILVDIFGNANTIISVEDRDGVLDAVSKREADVGLIDGYVDNCTLDYFQISSDPVGVLFHADNPMLDETAETIDWGMMPENFTVLTQINPGSMYRVQALLRKNGMNSSNFIETDSINIISKMSSRPDRVALLPKCCANQMMFAENLRFLPLTSPSVEIPVGFTTPRGLLSKSSFSKFVEHSRTMGNPSATLPVAPAKEVTA